MPSSANLIERHHLKPKSCGGKGTLLVCRDCADQIHLLFTNKQLERDYNTLEKLLAHPKIQKWQKWIRNKKRKS